MGPTYCVSQHSCGSKWFMMGQKQIDILRRALAARLDTAMDSAARYEQGTEAREICDQLVADLEALKVAFDEIKVED